jgi:hypothetical protein
MEISAGQMKLLHVLSKESGISHDELSASAKRSYGVSSLKHLSMVQAREMIDGLMPAQAKPVAPPKPQHYRFPRLPHIGPKPAARMMTPTEQAAMEKATNELDAELAVILAERPPRRPPRPAAPPAATAPARRPFGAKPPINPPVPAPVVKPEPVRIRLPSDPPRPASERQTGGFGRDVAAGHQASHAGSAAGSEGVRRHQPRRYPVLNRESHAGYKAKGLR